MVNFRAMASNMLARSVLGQALGRTFGGKRDLYEALGYKEELTPEDYRFRYRRNSVAARVIDAFPRGTWRGEAVELIESEDPEKITPFESAWTDLSTRLDIWPTLMRADILSGLGRYAVVFIGGVGGNIKGPMPKKVAPEDVQFLSVYSELNAKIKSFEDNINSPRFGQPLVYSLKSFLPGTKNIIWLDVHWDRIIHLADGALDEPMYGQPRLERVWNLLDDLEKITGGGSEAFWLRAHQGYQFNLDPETELDVEGEKQLSDEADEFANGIRRIVRTRGMEIKALGSDVATFDRNVLSVISQISSGTGIPQRILIGSEQGQLASEQDRVNWSERVQDRRTEFAGPMVVRPLVNRLLEHGILPPPIDSWTVRWPRVFDLSEGERVKLAQGIADINSKMKKQVWTVNEIRDKIFGMSAIPEKDQVPIEAPQPKVSGPVKSARPNAPGPALPVGG